MIVFENSSQEEKHDVFRYVLFLIGLLVLFLSLSAGIFVVGKIVLNLSLSWWTIVFSPVWLVLAAVIPGGFVITNIVLMLCDAMLIPWWVWVIATIGSLLQFGHLIMPPIVDFYP